MATRLDFMAFLNLRRSDVFGVTVDNNVTFISSISRIRALHDLRVIGEVYVTLYTRKVTRRALKSNILML